MAVKNTFNVGSRNSSMMNSTATTSEIRMRRIEEDNRSESDRKATSWMGRMNKRARMNSDSELRNSNSNITIASNSDSDGNCINDNSKCSSIKVSPCNNATMCSLPMLCLKRDWKGAIARLSLHPEEAHWILSLSSRKVIHDNHQPPLNNKNKGHNGYASSLALACRYNAPFIVIKSLVEAAPERLADIIPNRGTPLHEAACICTNLAVWRLLLEKVTTLHRNDRSNKNVCAMQDVDGHVPLHLLVRRALSTAGEELVLEMLNMLVKAYPEAVSISNYDEYRETPLVTALKSSTQIFIPSNNHNNNHTNNTNNNLNNDNAEKEKWILEVVKPIVTAYPPASSLQVPSKEYYTAIHSAVFHGRSADTVKLLLLSAATTHNTTTTTTVTDNPKQCQNLKLPGVEVPNSLQEIPLHLACMRGEGIRTLQYLVTPSTMYFRDATHFLTPLHWLWIRHVDISMEYEEIQHSYQQSTSSPLPPHNQGYKYLINSTKQTQPTSFDEVTFDAPYYCNIQNLDPPVDHRRMRHVPEYFHSYQHQVLDETLNSLNLNLYDRHTYFWAKVMCMLEAATAAKYPNSDQNLLTSSYFLHTACEHPTCPAIIHILLQINSEHLSLRSKYNHGNLPLHSIASRKWHPEEFKSPSLAINISNMNSFSNHVENTNYIQNDTTHPDLTIYEYINTTSQTSLSSNPSIVLQQEIDKSRNIIYLEPFQVLKLILQASDKRACRTCNNYNQLPLHCAIDTLISNSSIIEYDIVCPVLYTYISQYPEALMRRDGKSKLHPFAQIMATSYKIQTDCEKHDNLLALSLTYQLLRENPSVILHKFIQYQ